MKVLGRSALLLLASFGLLFLVLLSHVQLVSYSVAYYQSEFEKLGQPQELGTSIDQLALFSRQTTRYLRGLETEPNVRLVLYGQERWLLNSKEIAHMQDVQKLFRLARLVTAAGWTLVLLLVLVAWRRSSWRPILRFLALAASCSLFLGLGLGWLISRDFTSAFDSFHLLAFTNDLWQLNPMEDQLINLLPEQFFVEAAFLAVWRSGLTLLALALASGFASRRPINP